MSKFKVDNVLQAIGMIIVGVIMIIFPDSTQNAISKLIALILIICGIIKIYDYFREPIVGPEVIDPESGEKLKNYSAPSGFVIGILCIVFAALISKILVSIVPIVLGILVFYSGVAKLEQVVRVKRYDRTAEVTQILIFAVINIIVGLLVMFHPGVINDILLQLIGAGLAFGGITDLIAIGYTNKFFKNREK